MSQVAFIIDLPEISADVVRGQSLVRVAEDTARAIRKSHPVDDAIAVRAVFVSDNELIVSDGAPVDKPKRSRKPKTETE